jgi:hypothetical protein
MGPGRNSIRSAAALVAAVAAQQHALDSAAHEAAARAQQAQALVGGPSPALKARTPKTKAQLAQAVDGPPPTLNPAGNSGPQRTTGSTAVRKATATERLAAQRVMDPYGGHAGVPAAVERGLQRVGHRFRIEIRPDGTIVHRYGSDVPADQRVQAIRAARRTAANGGLKAP